MLRGERLAGRFEVVGEAARGGMGTVYRARDRKDGREVALKVLRAQHAHNEPRFEREAELLAGVRHEHIVEHVAHGVTPDGIRYLVMEWVEGETLADRLERLALTVHESVNVARQVARALAELHAHHVVHRDVKPSNVMLQGGKIDRVKVVDLGVARRARAEGRLTITGAIVGTAGYMAPEQVRGMRDLDGRADVFALGCMLYECLTGAQAFPGESTTATRAKVLLHDPAPVGSLVHGLPGALENLCARMLSKRADARPSAREVEAALGDLGELPDARPQRLHTAAKTTADPARVDVTFCAILIGTDVAPSAVEDALDTAANVDAIEGGIIITAVADADAAEKIARGLATRFSDTMVVAACGASPERALERVAKLAEHIELDAEIAGGRAVGVWIDGREPNTR
jgi:serine/threonine protein kinase